MDKVFLSKASTADYRMTGAVGAVTTLKTRVNQKILKSMGKSISI